MGSLSLFCEVPNSVSPVLFHSGIHNEGFTYNEDTNRVWVLESITIQVYVPSKNLHI